MNVLRRAFDEQQIHTRFRYVDGDLVNAVAEWLRDLTLLPHAWRKKDEHPDIFSINRALRLFVDKPEAHLIVFACSERRLLSKSCGDLVETTFSGGFLADWIMGV